MAMAVHRAVHGGTDALVIDGDDFTGKYIPHELRINGIQCRRFRSQYPAVLRLSQHQGAIAEGIPAAVDGIVGAGHDGIGTVDFIHELLEFFFFRGPAASGQQLNNDFRIHGGGESGAFQKEAAPQILRVHQVPVMGQCHGAVNAVGLQGLHVYRNGGSGGGIAHMADADVAFLFRQIVEYLRHQAHAAEGFHCFPIRNGNARTFLAPVLQSKDTVVGFMHRRQIPVKNTKHSALFMRLVIIYIHTFIHYGILLTFL